MDTEDFGDRTPKVGSEGSRLHWVVVLCRPCRGFYSPLPLPTPAASVADAPLPKGGLDLSRLRRWGCGEGRKRRDPRLGRDRSTTPPGRSRVTRHKDCGGRAGPPQGIVVQEPWGLILRADLQRYVINYK